MSVLDLEVDNEGRPNFNRRSSPSGDRKAPVTLEPKGFRVFCHHSLQQVLEFKASSWERIHAKVPAVIK